MLKMAPAVAIHLDSPGPDGANPPAISPTISIANVAAANIVEDEEGDTKNLLTDLVNDIDLEDRKEGKREGEGSIDQIVVAGEKEEKNDTPQEKKGGFFHAVRRFFCDVEPNATGSRCCCCYGSRDKSKSRSKSNPSPKE